MQCSGLDKVNTIILNTIILFKSKKGVLFISRDILQTKLIRSHNFSTKLICS